MAPLRLGIIILSDKASQGEREDLSGPLLRDLAVRGGWNVEKLEVLPDDPERLEQLLLDYSDKLGLDLILTSGGTGLSSRDTTPEVTARVLEKEIPGIAEILRIKGFEKKKTAVLSRGRAGFRGRSLIINLPGSPAAAAEGWEILQPVIPHALEVLQGRGAECGLPGVNLQDRQR